MIYRDQQGRIGLRIEGRPQRPGGRSSAGSSAIHLSVRPMDDLLYDVSAYPSADLRGYDSVPRHWAVLGVWRWILHVQEIFTGDAETYISEAKDFLILLEERRETANEESNGRVQAGYTGTGDPWVPVVSGGPRPSAITVQPGWVNLA